MQMKTVGVFIIVKYYPSGYGEGFALVQIIVEGQRMATMTFINQ